MAVEPVDGRKKEDQAGASKWVVEKAIINNIV
jgi:hypothetical protein